MHNRTFSLFAFLALVFLSTASFAAPALFGPEFNFTSNAMIAAGLKAGPATIGTPEERAAQKLFLERVIEKCPECVITETPDKHGIASYSVKTAAGWSFVISLDPWVVEIQADPMTADQIAENESEIQRLIFNTAREVNLFSQDFSGHIHIGVASAFERDPLLFRNFLVDWIMHSRMAFQIFGASETNAPTIDVIGPGSLSNLEEILRAFDESGIWKRKGEAPKMFSWIQDRARRLKAHISGPLTPDQLFANTPKGYEIDDLANAILKFVYFQTAQNVAPPEKYQNVNLSRMVLAWIQQTVELRSVHEMRSATEYLAFAQLLQGRLNYLSKLTEPIPFTGIQRYDTQSAVDAYNRYAFEAGMEWSDVAPTMIRRYRTIKPSEAQTCQAVFFSAAEVF